MIGLALHGVVGFSDVPLRMALWVGFAVSTIAGVLSIYIVILGLYDYTLVRGWASTLVLVSFLSGINLFMTGVVGLYVGRIHAEAKKRPLYVIARTIGLHPEEPEDSLLFDRRATRASPEPERLRRKSDAAV
jgi:dolichol-phosphate mannosyltransferase